MAANETTTPSYEQIGNGGGAAGQGLNEAPLGFRVQPHNSEAEQALLGAILVNNEAYHKVSEYLISGHFYEPVHQRIFEACHKTIQRGTIADHNTLFHLFETDPALQGEDGRTYLARLAAAASTIFNAEEYGRVIHDLALRRSLIGLGEDVVNRAFDPLTDLTGKDQIENAERELFELAQEGERKGDFVSFPDVLAKATSHIEGAFHKTGRVTGVPTGLAALDRVMGGLQKSDLVILAGRPSMGKSALAMSMAANAAGAANPDWQKDGERYETFVVGVFSLEMSSEQLATRLLSAQAQIPSDELRRGEIDGGQWAEVVKASQLLGKKAIFLDDTPALSISALRTRARRLQRTQGLHLLVVDYLQLMSASPATASQGRVQAISEITQGLKAIAKELDIPVLALSQLSRQVEQREDKRPMLSDLRESGSIEQDADVVMFVYRDEYYLSRQVPSPRDNEPAEKFDARHQAWFERLEAAHNKAEIIVSKQRHGRTGTVHVQFDASFGEFRNLETEVAEYGRF